MAEPVVDDDYGWFTPADLAQVVRAIHRLADWHRVILIGGQSLTAWVQAYGIELPTFEGPYLTADADFLASKADADVIASCLKEGKTYYPGLDDATPNTAVVDFTGTEGTILRIDLLGCVLGVKDSDVRKLAVSIAIEGIEDLPPMNVLHPLLVLESRCINLERLAEKRNANGITQARVACLVVKKYIEDCLNNPTRRREVLKAARRVFRLGRSRAGVFVYQRYGIDVLSVIDQERMPGQFALSWTWSVQHVNIKRAIAARLGRGTKAA